MKGLSKSIETFILPQYPEIESFEINFKKYKYEVVVKIKPETKLSFAKQNQLYSDVKNLFRMLGPEKDEYVSLILDYTED